MKTNPGWRSLAVRSGALAVLAILLIFSSAPALAKKPVKPPPEPEDTSSIFLRYADTSDPYTNPEPYPNDVDRFEARINPDGSNYRLGMFGVPSLAEHGAAAERWYLQVRALPEGSDPADKEFYPCGTRRAELFAVSESGVAIQLTDDPRLRFNGPVWGKGGTGASPQWSVDEETGLADGKVSFLGIRWNEGGISGERPVPPVDLSQHWVEEHGLYVLRIDWSSGQPQVTGLPERIDVGQPTDVYELQYSYTVTDPDTGDEEIIYAVAGPDVEVGGQLYVHYVWSPDGSSLAFMHWTESHDNPDYGIIPPAEVYPGLWRLDATTDWDPQQAVQLTTVAWLVPRAWHPSGDRIAVWLPLEGTIHTLNPWASAPQDLPTLISLPRKARNISNFAYSPDGTQVAYAAWYVPAKVLHFDQYHHLVFRAAVDGSDATQILDARQYPNEAGRSASAPMAWR